MKRSRRVILTLMGSTTIGAISMGFISKPNCGPGFVREITLGLDGKPIASCQPVAFGGFGHFPHRFHGHGHAHGGG
ncbi:MAG TPA: hypothetical protein VKT76_11610 [Bradyrhizobium sp.]|nr:hypothetical protein [Bradyrhizobium sp.]